MPPLLKEINKDDAIRLNDQDIFDAIQKGEEPVLKAENIEQQEQDPLLDIEISIRTLERLGAFEK